MTAPVVVPTTTAPAQSISVTLGGQACRIELYSKSINVVAQPGPAFLAMKLVGIAYGVSLSGTAMTVSGSVVGELPLGSIVTGDGLVSGTVISTVPPNTRLGTYGLSQPTALTPVTRVTAYVSSLRPGSQILVDPPLYQNANPVFIDLYSNDALVVGGVLLRNRNAIVRNSYFGFVGDLTVIDTVGDADPEGVPLRLPSVELRNAEQRAIPLAFGGNYPPDVAMTIPGMGTRFLLTYWPDLQ